MRNDPATVRFRGIAAILARGVTRVRRSSDLLADEPTVSGNLADSLPNPLEIAREPSLWRVSRRLRPLWSPAGRLPNEVGRHQLKNEIRYEQIAALLAKSLRREPTLAIREQNREKEESGRVDVNRDEASETAETTEMIGGER